MASRFASISEKEILSMNEEAVPKNAKMATKSGVYQSRLDSQDLLLRTHFTDLKGSNTVCIKSKLTP